MSPSPILPNTICADLQLGKHSSHCTGVSACLSTLKTEYKGMSPSPFSPQCLLYVCHHTSTMHSTSGIQGSWTLNCTLLQLPLPPKELKKKMPGIKEEGAFTSHASLSTLNTHSSHLWDYSSLLWKAFFTEPPWFLSLDILPFSALGDLMCIKRKCCLFSCSSTLPPWVASLWALSFGSPVCSSTQKAPYFLSFPLPALLSHKRCISEWDRAGPK